MVPASPVGGSEATALITSASNGGGIGYLGLSDAKTVVAGGGSIIAYNGAYPFTGYTPGGIVSATPDFSPITTGQYSFWSFERLLMRSGAPANIQTFWLALPAAIDNDLATATPVTSIRMSDMKVTRNDGGPIHP